MKVLLADDHSVVREGLKEMIKKMDMASIIVEVQNGREALDEIEKDGFDLIILDISMPGISGLSVLETLRSRDIKTRILVLSMHPQEQYAIRAFRLGASGYLSKDSAYEELEIAIKKISAGRKYISASFVESLIFDKKNESDKAPHEKLSEREFHVMYLIAQGKSVTEISNELFISDKTVSTHRARILGKMGLKKNAELTLYAIKNGLIE